MSSADLHALNTERQIGLFVILAPLPLFLVVWLCRDRSIAPVQEARQNVQPLARKRKRKSEALAVLTSHVVTVSDLHHTNGKDSSDRVELVEAGTFIINNSSENNFVTAGTLADEVFCHKEGTLLTTSKPYHACNGHNNESKSICSAVYMEEYCSSAAGSNINQSMTDGNIIDLSGPCTICFDEYVEGDLVSSSKNPSCKHVFHQHCLLPWLILHDNCPSCRWNLFAEKDISSLPFSVP